MQTSHAYGPPPPSQQGYGPQGYGQGYGPGPGFQPPKRGMGGGMIAIIVFSCLFASCAVCNMVTSSRKHDAPKPVASVAPDPSAIAAKQKAEEEAKAEKERVAVETFPTKKSEITAAIAKAKTAADTNKWAQADTELTTAEEALAAFKGTSIADAKDFQDLEVKSSTLRMRVNPQIQKIAKAASAAAEEKDLKANSVVVTNSQLFNDYQSNEVAADNKYKGKKLLVTGTVASIDKGPFGGLLLRLASPNEFMNTTCDMENSEKGSMASLQKGETVRVLSKGTGMVIGTPQLDDCVFK